VPVISVSYFSPLKPQFNALPINRQSPVSYHRSDTRPGMDKLDE